jgi:DNA-binding MarR family transcriptional regulator
MTRMDALDLFQLGRWLTRLGEDAMRPLGAPPSPPGQRLILMDAFAFPDSSVGEIAVRTGLPQSYVSEIVARLRDLGAFETRADPGDRRRTLVKVSDALPPAVAGLGATPVDELLTEALGEAPADRAAELIEALSEVTARLRARLGGPETPDARLRDAGKGRG